MMSNGRTTRSMEGAALEAVLDELARVHAIAGSVKIDMEPLSDEDKEAGAEPLTPEQIQGELERIMVGVTRVVLNHLGASPEEWYAANDKIK